MATWHTYFVTFGLKYAHEYHPMLGDISPEQYVVVVAPDEDKARELVNRLTDGAWAFMYTQDDFKREYHPLGSFDTWIWGAEE